MSKSKNTRVWHPRFLIRLVQRNTHQSSSKWSSCLSICALSVLVLPVLPELVFAEYGSNGFNSKSVDEGSLIIEGGFPVTAPAGSPYTIGQGGQGELIGLAGTTVPSAAQSAPQWVLAFTPVLNPGFHTFTIGIGGMGVPNYPHTPITYEQAIAANPITTFTIPVPLTRRVNFDVTDFMQSLPIYDSGVAQYLGPLFTFRSLQASDNVLAVMLDPELLWRDGSWDAPFLPIGPVGEGGFHFGNRGGLAPRWYDPPAASAFEYQATDGTLFTQIADFPTGFDSPFTVTVGNTVLGEFSPGQSVDFTLFGAGGVSSFVVSGISPSVDPTNELAFPLALVFNRDEVRFTMTAVPEPSSRWLVAAVICGFAALLGIRRFGRWSPCGLSRHQT